VLPFRPKYTRSAYKQIWTSEGSPLVRNTQKIGKALKNKTGWDVRVAMRYQEPSIRQVFEKINKDGGKDVIVVPLYPHNAMATVGSTRKEVEEVVESINPELRVEFIKPFFNHPAYIECLVKSIRPYLSDETDMLLFSYHGLPERQIRKSDPLGTHCMNQPNCCDSKSLGTQKCYRANTLHTSQSIADRLGLDENKWRTSFQSRVSSVGPKWLTPYTSEELKNFPKAGSENIAVVCPSFICDCLETLFEIDIEGRQIFKDSGGHSFKFIPCLNNDPDFIDCLELMVSDLIMN